MVASLLAGATISNYYFPNQKRVTLYKLQPPQYVAESAGVVRNVPVEDIPVPKLRVLKPTEKQKAKIEKKIGGELPKDREILDVVEIKPLPYGGYGVIGLTPPTQDGEGSQKVDIKIYGRKPPFFEWTPERIASLYGGTSGEFGGTGSNTSGLIANLELQQNLLRTGPAIWGFKAGVFITPSESRYYAMFGASVKF